MSFEENDSVLIGIEESDNIGSRPAREKTALTDWISAAGSALSFGSRLFGLHHRYRWEKAA
jgi:hypothetical protein